MPSSHPSLGGLFSFFLSDNINKQARKERTNWLNSPERANWVNNVKNKQAADVPRPQSVGGAHAA